MKKREIPMRAPGCVWQFWFGSIGIDSRLQVYDGQMPTGFAGDLTQRSRKALADHMIRLWTRFRDEEPAARSRSIFKLKRAAK